MTDKIKLEFRGMCPKCKTERSIVTAYVATNAESMDALEDEIDKRGGFEAHCPTCDHIEEIAFFANNKQTEPWLPANIYEERNGADAGPLPPKTWNKNDNE